MDCIIAMNHEGKVIEWNPRREKTFGYRRAEVLGREMSELSSRQNCARHISRAWHVFSNRDGVCWASA